MSLRTPAIIVVGALLTGCVTQNNEQPFAFAYPASPNAPEAPLPPESQTLAIHQNASKPVPEQGPVKQLQPEMSGMVHQHGDMAGKQHQEPSTQPGENAAVSAPRWTPTTLPTTAAAAVYTCPMHPQVRSDTPGKCPICGMKLVAARDHANHSGHGGQP